jgi:hypothetical protein
VAHASTVTAAAATVTSTTASRQPYSSLIAAVNGLPTTRARLVPTYTAVVARPACDAGTNRAPMGAITDHISPWVSAHNTRPPASTVKLGASAEISCDAVKHTSVSSRVVRLRPPRGKPHQRNGGQGGDERVACQQCPHQRLADPKIGGDRRQRVHV